MTNKDVNTYNFKLDDTIYTVRELDELRQFEITANKKNSKLKDFINTYMDAIMFFSLNSKGISYDKDETIYDYIPEVKTEGDKAVVNVYVMENTRESEKIYVKKDKKVI